MPAPVTSCPAAAPASSLATVRNADSILVMVGGHVAEQGKHSALMRRGGIYAGLVRRQSGAVVDKERDLAPHVRHESKSHAEGTATTPVGGSNGAESLEKKTGRLSPDSLAAWQAQRRTESKDRPG